MGHTPRGGRGAAGLPSAPHGGRGSPPRDLGGIIQALRSYNPARGSLRHCAARWALQRAYDAVRRAARHEDEIAALEIGEVESLLEDFRAAPEDVVFRQQPRERLARYAATLVRSASDAARALLHELMVGDNGTTPEERLTALGLTPQQVDRARTEVRALGVAATKNTMRPKSGPPTITRPNVTTMPTSFARTAEIKRASGTKRPLVSVLCRQGPCHSHDRDQAECVRSPVAQMWHGKSVKNARGQDRKRPDGEKIHSAINGVMDSHAAASAERYRFESMPTASGKALAGHCSRFLH